MREARPREQPVDVKPRDAASVVLVRPSQPWTVLLFRRPMESAFAPGSFVFPGGSVEPEDWCECDPWRAAAIRETFEEVGILLARRPDGRLARADDCRMLRAAISAGTRWPDALRATPLTAALDLLVAIDRWVTPPIGRRRYDTSFYVALVPPDQEPVPNADEVREMVWMAPEDASSDSALPMLAVTRRILADIATLDSSVFGVGTAQETPPARMARVRQRPDGSFEYLGYEVVGNGQDRLVRAGKPGFDILTNDC